MKKLLIISAALFAALLVGAAGCSNDVTDPFGDTDAAEKSSLSPSQPRAVIANRASGTISVINRKDLSVSGTYDLPAEAGEPTPEPMYVVHVKNLRRVFVDDRANERVVVFDARDFAVEATVPVGAGAFHMWADPKGRQLWVNNDVDKTTTVIDPRDLTVLATVPTPADLVAMGGKPHDVVVGPEGMYAYVSVLGVPGDHDYVVQFDTDSFAEVNRAAVGKDPHLSLARQHDWLYVPCQNSDQVVVLDRHSLDVETILTVPGAHGAAMTGNGRYFYTANLPGGGQDALQAIDTATNTLAGEATNTPYPVPHNLALDPAGKVLFVTHSGASADKVTVYRMKGDDPTPRYVGEVTVGLNPFGLAYVQ
jgi:DNA-binding beta-propeller fold protein YncE